LVRLAHQNGVEAEFAHVADLPRARQALAEVSQRMHARGYIVANDGNVSVRIGESKLLVTPSGARKAFLKAADMVLCDLRGRPVAGEKRRPSSELPMHLAVYEERPDVNAVVHAHPPCAVAHTIAGVSLAVPLMPEAFCALGDVLTLPYTTPTTEQVPDALREPIRTRVALMMARHGSITVGATLDQAYDRLEVLEHTARISMFSRVLGGKAPEGLDERQLEELRIFLGCGLGG
jgi:L-fuculose-phosphate aldolase